MVTRTSYRKQEQKGLFKRGLANYLEMGSLFIRWIGQEEESQIDWVNGHCVNRWKAVSDSLLHRMHGCSIHCMCAARLALVGIYHAIFHSINLKRTQIFAYHIEGHWLR